MPLSKEKMVEYRKIHYQQNKERYAEYQRAKRREVAQWFLEFKSDKKCKECGETHPRCLDFHHRENKEMGVSYMVRQKLSKERILNEIQKCDVLCANCHRKLHWKEDL